MNLFKLIASDLRAKAEWLYGEYTPLSLLKVCLTDGSFAMVVYRLMQASRRRRLRLPAMLFNKLNVWLGGCIIGRGADFGPGLVFIHSDGLVINSAVRGGSRIKLEHRVTIGAEKGASPVLGNDVFVGVGAVIIGGVRIGNRTRVGANAVVNIDVPDDHTAVGVPARIIRCTDHVAPSH